MTDLLITFSLPAWTFFRFVVTAATGDIYAARRNSPSHSAFAFADVVIAVI